MRTSLRLAWVVCTMGMFVFALGRGGGAWQELRPPMPPDLFATRKVTDRLFVIAPSGPDMSNVGGNIGVFVADEGVLVVDDNYYRQVRNGQTVEMAEAVVAEIRKLTARPIRFIVNTHHHGDHAGGNPVFAKLGTIYAQKNVRGRLLAGYRSQKEPLTFDPLAVLPTVTYDGELVIHLGGEDIHLYHPSRAHTDGDSLVYFAQANVAFWGDAFANNWVPVIDAGAGGSSIEWLRFIDRGIELAGESARMVPGHGAIGTAADVRRFRAYFTALHARVAEAIAAGMTREQAVDAVTVPGYEKFPGGAARIRANVAAVYDELRASAAR